MIIPSGVAPHWLDSQTRDSAATEVSLDSPAADPTEEPTTVLLRVNADDDGFRWSVYIEVPAEAPFNEGEIEWGSALDLETAKRDAWSSAVAFLKDLGHVDQEINEAAAGGHGRPNE